MVIILSLLYMDRIIITIVLFILLSVPFIVFRNRISKWLSSATKDSTDKKEQKENALSQNIFILLSVLLSPIFIKQVYMTDLFYVYMIAYIVIALALLLVDPFNIITINKFSALAYVPATFLAFYVLLYTQTYSAVLLLCIFVLAISMTNMAMSYVEKKNVWLFLAYTIPYCIAYVFALRPSLIQSLFKKSNSPSVPIQMNPVLLGCVFFFCFVFYAATIMSHYYGNPLVNEPIPLNQPAQFVVDPSYQYTISYWVYLNAVPPEYSLKTKLFNNLLSCGNSIQNRYNTSTSTLRVVAGSNVKDLPMLPQQWNHVVLVGREGIVDVYMNAKIVYTVHTTGRPGPALVVGQQQGCKGKICNVVYSKKVMTSLQIEQLNAQFKLRNPPCM